MSITQGQIFTADGVTLQLVAGQFSAKIKVKTIFSAISSVTNWSTANNFIGISGFSVATTAVEAAAQIAMPVAGTFKNLYVNQASASQTASTVTIRKNGVSGTLTATTVLNTASVVSDTVNTVTVVAGDLVCWQLTGVSAQISGSITVEFDPSA